MTSGQQAYCQIQERYLQTGRNACPDRHLLVPDTLKKDVDDFCEVVKEELSNVDFFKSAGVRGGTEEQSLKQLESTFM